MQYFAALGCRSPPCEKLVNPLALIKVDFMRILAVFCSLFFASFAAFGVDQYTGEIEVASQDETLRKEAMVGALGQVLVKVSGDPAAAGRPSLKSALENPEPLIQAYYYRQEIDRSGVAPVMKLYYAANFDPRAISRLLSSSGLSQWARERPALMVWVAADQNGSAALLHESRLAPLMRRANERGIVVKAASIVADESGIEQLADVENRELDSLRQVAAKSGTPGVLAGRLYATEDGVVGRFGFSDGERNEQFEVRGVDAPAALRAAADETANRLASRYAFDAADSAPVAVAAVIRGVSDAREFARVHAYLLSLSVVRSVSVSGAAAQTLNLNLVVAGGAERLRQIVALNDMLKVAGDSTDGALVFDAH